MQKLNYIPPAPASPSRTQNEIKSKIEKLEVQSTREQQEMDFSKIIENNELPPDLEPID